MNLIGNILSKILPHHQQAMAAQAAPQAPESIAAPAAQSAPQQVDVVEVLEGMASKHNGALNWRTSIVDLMKLLDMDSSLSARKQLASELGFSGDTADSASMNMWLQKQVMQKLAENGGQVPEDLRH